MIRGTTPILILELEGAHLNSLQEIYITIKQDEYEIEKDINSVMIVDDSTLQITLTQEETLMLEAFDCYGRPNYCEIQFRGAKGKDFAIASDTVRLSVGEILKEGEIGQ